MGNAAGEDRLDLEIRRTIKAPPSLIWMVLTDAEHLKKWFVPRPWTIPEAEIDPRPGGKFYLRMAGPNGEESGAGGCVLEAVENEKLSWTDALTEGYRPAEKPFMTAIITMKPVEGGTEYVARALHHCEADRVQHEEMGFFDGWGTVADQLAELVEKIHGDKG
ncbi:MAG: SRPBCC family protein [Maricaulaceae bacterium]